jgi:hypothetical protein
LASQNWELNKAKGKFPFLWNVVASSGFHGKGKMYSDLWFFIPARKPEVTTAFNSSDGVDYLYDTIV